MIAGWVPGMPMIAVVDDDESVCEATGTLLRSLGHRIATFANAEEFLKSGQLHEISCLITDVQMPGMSGIELQAHLKAESHRIPVIVITAFPDGRIRDRAMQQGATCVLNKPFSQASLTVCLDRALKSGSAGTRAVVSG
jgi:FixJ family two-component response regulator